MRAQWDDTPSEPKWSEEDEEDEEEGEVIPPHTSTHSPLREALPLLGDIFRMQVGIVIDARRPKWTQTGTRPSTILPPQTRLALVAPGSKG
jgi:hypothetical protein